MSTDQPSNATDQTQPSGLPDFAQYEVIGQIETDQFCRACSHSLFGQPVRRDPRTAIPIVRCDACHGIQAAGDATSVNLLWTRRLAVVGLFLWMAAIVVLLLGLLGAFLGICGGTFDEMQWLLRYGQRNYDPSIMIPRETEFQMMASLLTAVSVAIGFAFSFVTTTTLSHWRRWGYFLCPAVGLALVMVVFWLIVALGYPNDIISSGYWLILTGYIACFAIGNIAAIFVGRPLARWAIRLLLPRRWVPRFSFLWQADGLDAPPGVVFNEVAATESGGSSHG